MMPELVEFQISLSTAEEELNYFTGHEAATFEVYPAPVMPAGTYRMVDGRLYRIVPEAAPISAP